jgi:hypothetical protein
VQGSEQHCRRDEQPNVRATLLKQVGKLGHDGTLLQRCR